MIAAVLFSAALAAAPADVDAAIALAHADEASLPAEQHVALVKAQTTLLDKTFSACMPAEQKEPLPAFTVVLQLDAAGKPRQSWLKGDTAVARCVEKVLAGQPVFVPPRAPFYTFFELSFEP